MKLLEAIAKADNFRLNTIDEEIKAKWVYTVDCAAAEVMRKDRPEESFPSDRELLMPSPHDEIYVYYLNAMIDYYNGEIELYRNDISVFESAMKQAGAWYQRSHAAKNYGAWEV